MAVARRRADVAPLRRCGYVLPERAAWESRVRLPDSFHPQALETEPTLHATEAAATAPIEEALSAQQPIAEPPDLTEAESLAAGPDDVSSGQMPPDVGKRHEDVMQSPTVALALPIYAPAPPPDTANAYALINGETPWSAVAVCRQQAERLAQLEAEILEECRQKQERLWQSEFAEVLDQRAQEWRQQRLELESQISYQEQRYTSAQLAWRQSEVNAQRDAQLRHQAISDRCLAISEELAVARAGFETERFQLEQDVGRLQAEMVTSASEANAVKLEARTMNTCLQQELSAEVSTAAHLAQSAASRRDEALSECQAAEAKLAKQQLEQRSNVDELLQQRTALEESFQYAEHQQRLSQQRASQEEEVAAKATAERQHAQTEVSIVQTEREELAALVVGLTAELQAASKEMDAERETRRAFERVAEESQRLQATYLAEAQAAKETAEAAATTAALEVTQERRERARDLCEFHTVLQQHQEQLSVERHRQIFSELCGTLDRTSDCE